MEELRSPAISLGLEGDCIRALLRVLLLVVVKNPKEEAMLHPTDSQQGTKRGKFDFSCRQIRKNSTRLPLDVWTADAFDEVRH